MKVCLLTALILSIGWTECTAMPTLDVNIPIETNSNAWLPLDTDSHQSETDPLAAEALGFDDKVALNEILKHLSGRHTLGAHEYARYQHAENTQKPSSRAETLPSLFSQFLSNIRIDVDLFDSIRSLFGDDHFTIITLGGKIIDLSQAPKRHAFYTQKYYPRGQNSDSLEAKIDYSEDTPPLTLYLNRWFQLLITWLTHPLAIATFIIFTLFFLPVIVLLRNRRF